MDMLRQRGAGRLGRLCGRTLRLPFLGNVWIDPVRRRDGRRFAYSRTNYVPVLRLFGYEMVLDTWWGRKRYKRRGEIRIREARWRSMAHETTDLNRPGLA